MHIFPYSVRPGTKAAAMSGQLTRTVKESRAAQARAVADAMEKEYLVSCVGKSLPVIFETEKDGWSYGHADNYCQVAIQGHGERGVVTNVKIISTSEQMLVGIVI